METPKITDRVRFRAEKILSGSFLSESVAVCKSRDTFTLADKEDGSVRAVHPEIPEWYSYSLDCFERAAKPTIIVRKKCLNSK